MRYLPWFKTCAHVLKVVERIIDIIRNRAKVDDLYLGFIPGYGATDAVLIVRQIQEKYIKKNRNMFFAFVDLEKIFDRVHRRVIWWGLGKVSIPE